MKGNIDKFKNWRAITESDYVTMFIKTWFAFIATLRELYPKEKVEDIIGKGDRVFLNPYLDDFNNIYSFYNDLEKVKDNILCVYKLGRNYTLKEEKYNRFFSEDFYMINNKYSYKRSTEDYVCSIKKTSGNMIDIQVVYLNKKYWKDEKPFILNSCVDFSDLIKIDLTKNEIEKYYLDESAYIDDFAEALRNRISNTFISDFLSMNLDKSYSKSVYASLEALTSQEINNVLGSSMYSMQDYGTPKDELLYMQQPCPNFIYNVEDGKTPPKNDTYKWFLNFVYFLRNALFHEIIDPLDSFWQDIFKSAYLALKEILDANINYFLEREDINVRLETHILNFINDNKAYYFPKYEGEITVKKIEYEEFCVTELEFLLKFEVSIEYWPSENVLKYTKIIGKAVFERKNENRECKEITLAIE